MSCQGQAPPRLIPGAAGTWEDREELHEPEPLVRGYYFCYFGAQACMASYLNVYLEQQLGFGGRELGWFNRPHHPGPGGGAAAAGDLGGPDRQKRPAAHRGPGGGAAGGRTAPSPDRAGGVLLWGAVWETARSACVSLADKGAVELAGTGALPAMAASELRLPGVSGGGMVLGFAARQWTLGRVLFPSTWPGGGRPCCCPWASINRIRPAPRGAKRPVAWGSLFRHPGFLLALVLGVQGQRGGQRPAAPAWATIWLPPWGPRPPSWAGTPLCCVGPELLLLPLVGGRLLQRWGFVPWLWSPPWPLALRCAIYALASSRKCFWPGRCSTASACAYAG